jgi:hypothetical protein
MRLILADHTFDEVPTRLTVRTANSVENLET